MNTKSENNKIRATTITLPNQKMIMKLKKYKNQFHSYDVIVALLEESKEKKV